MKPIPQVSESHLFTMFGKDILFNVETILFYEVSPVVRDIFQLISRSGSLNPQKVLKSRYREAETGKKINLPSPPIECAMAINSELGVKIKIS